MRVSNKSSEDFYKEFWTEKINAKKRSFHRYPVVNGEMFRVGNDTDYVKGFCGTKFCIKFFDGAVVYTNNLWHNGTIPDNFKKSLPDDATLETIK